MPWREIFVYSRRVEGIHLRAGPVARGGIRWSDRRDDFRTEILGLMKAQRVKNAVIVPTGAKGGFYPKQLPDPATTATPGPPRAARATSCSSARCSSLTDNIVGDKVVHPPSVVIHDGDDPYFVVAADKGTATFSDAANAIAAEHDFWLGDAFASGGSNGYDHKAMGITAKGAWISVQRHFLELGIDVQKRSGARRRLRRHVGRRVRQRHAAVEGDQAGRRVRPPPRVHRSRSRSGGELEGAQAAVRAAALELGATTAAKLISKGGGIYPRTMKRIALSQAGARRARHRQRRVRSRRPDQRHPQGPVDLLWFGGIGTYVNASSETTPRSAIPPTTRCASAATRCAPK